MGLGVAWGAAQAGGIEDLLPQDGFAGEWQREDLPQYYPGASLYGHIDGGAELFFEFGFDQAIVQRYLSGKEQFTVEIYRMNDPVAALGVYLIKAGREAPDPLLKVRHTVGTLQLAFVRGQYFGLITNESGKPERRTALLAFAASIASRLPADRPIQELSRLPKLPILPETIRFVRGPMGLESMVTFGPGDVLDLKGKVLGVAGDYLQASGQPATVMVIDYPNPSAATSALERLRTGLDPEWTVIDRAKGRLFLKNNEGKFTEARRDGARITLDIGLEVFPRR